jgi:hypothetical protein
MMSKQTVHFDEDKWVIYINVEMQKAITFYLLDPSDKLYSLQGECYTVCNKLINNKSLSAKEVEYIQAFPFIVSSLHVKDTIKYQNLAEHPDVECSDNDVKLTAAADDDSFPDPTAYPYRMT